MNSYVDVVDLKRAVRIAAATTLYDADLLRLATSASRDIDARCARHFYTMTEARYFDTIEIIGALRGGAGIPSFGRMAIDDVLSITEFACDANADGTFSEIWTEDTDFVLWPYNRWPKNQIQILGYGTKSLLQGTRYLKITGTWGYGDGALSSPWVLQSVTADVDAADGLDITISDTLGIGAGRTLKIADEQVLVTAVSEDGKTLSCIRGVNGTTGVVHDAATVSLASYPDPIVTACIRRTGAAFYMSANSGLKSEKIGDYSYTLDSGADNRETDIRELGPYRILNVSAPRAKSYVPSWRLI